MKKSPNRILVTFLLTLYELLKGETLFIHSGYFYSASLSPLLLRGAPDTARRYNKVS